MQHSFCEVGVKFACITSKTSSLQELETQFPRVLSVMFVQTAELNNKLKTATLYDLHWAFYSASFIWS